LVIRAFRRRARIPLGADNGTVTEKHEGYEHMREAIGVMTAWASSGDAAFASAYYNKLLDDYGAEKARDVVAGLINLCGELLAIRAKEKGVGESETLREIAERIADR
jgi:hypothetical protein